MNLLDRNFVVNYQSVRLGIFFALVVASIKTDLQREMGSVQVGFEGLDAVEGM